MALRFHRIEDESEWKVMKPNMKAINKQYRKRKGIVMFPTSHDITPESVDNYIIVLRKLLKSGNHVLITTKADYKCIDKIYEEVLSKDDLPNKYLRQVEFRITIGSIYNDILKKYEPNAPSFRYSRFNSLSILTGLGFKTSVSIEPFLDKDPTYLIRFVAPHTDGDIWLGLMSGAVPEELKPNYTRENLLKIVDNIHKLPEEVKSRIRYKDSIRNKLVW